MSHGNTHFVGNNQVFTMSIFVVETWLFQTHVTLGISVGHGKTQGDCTESVHKQMPLISYGV